MLIPRGEARYVVRGQAVSPLGLMLSRLDSSLLRRPTQAKTLASKQAELASEVSSHLI